MIYGIVRKINKRPKVQRYIIYGVLAYVIYTIVNEIRFGLFHSGTMIEGMSSGSKLTLFHMNGCPHCVKMMPEWDKFAKLNPGKCEKHEASDVQDLTKKLNIQGFPTIMLLDANNNKIKDYDGDRTAAGFKAFLTQN